MSSATRPRLSSQSKKPNPASPDQSVPSQSNTASCAFSCKTLWMKAAVLEGEFNFAFSGFILMEGIISLEDLTTPRIPREYSHSLKHEDHRPGHTAGAADSDVQHLWRWPWPVP